MKASAKPVRRTALLTVLMGLAAVIVLAGCGGSSAADDPSITKAELITRGDAICRQTDVIQKERLAAYEKAHPKVFLGGAAGEKALRLTVFPPIGVEIKKVAALGIPGGDRVQLHAILNGWSNALKKVERKPAFVLTGEGPFTRPDQLAARYGFKDCAQAL